VKIGYTGISFNTEEILVNLIYLITCVLNVDRSVQDRPSLNES